MQVQETTSLLRIFLAASVTDYITVLIYLILG